MTKRKQKPSSKKPVKKSRRAVRGRISEEPAFNSTHKLEIAGRGRKRKSTTNRQSGARATATPSGHEVQGSGHDSGAVGHELVGLEAAPAVEVEMVKCRFCPVLIPKPEGTTVYECAAHINLTGSFKNPHVRK